MSAVGDDCLAVAREFERLIPGASLVTPLRPGPTVRSPTRKTIQRLCSTSGQLFESGTFRPFIDRHYPLSEIVEAYRFVGSGQKIGNVVIDVAPSS